MRFIMDISSFELVEYEKLARTLDLGKEKDDEIQVPNRDYLMAWSFGYVKGDCESVSKTI